VEKVLSKTKRDRLGEKLKCMGAARRDCEDGLHGGIAKMDTTEGMQSEMKGTDIGERLFVRQPQLRPLAEECPVTLQAISFVRKYKKINRGASMKGNTNFESSAKAQGSKAARIKKVERSLSAQLDGGGIDKERAALGSCTDPPKRLPETPAGVRAVESRSETTGRQMRHD
jgi:hypothetical protein